MEELQTATTQDQKVLSIDELNKLYTDAKEADREVHAEMRSNVLLIAGEHYTRKLMGAATRGSQQSSDPKLRITKNWIHRAHRLYVNAILSKAPGAMASPRNPYELQDKKSAELNQSVLEYIKDKYKVRKKIRELCSDYVGIGEACILVKFNPDKGEVEGYEPMVDELGGELVDEAGQSVPDKSKPVLSGEFEFKRIFGHQLFRDPGVSSMEDSTFIGVDTLVDMAELKRRYKNDEAKLKMLQKSTENFVIFDSNKGGYGKSDNQVNVREFYFKPCKEYPQGYFYFTTLGGVLESGPLPYGVYPIKWVGFDEHATKVRATSLVKIAKPWQAEINRASSQAAIHGITTADDKILTQAGTKLETGTVLPGVRGLTYAGAPPTILPGRVGDQFYEYIDRNENEMSRALLLDRVDEEKMNNLDPFAMLFRSMGQSAHFSLYAEKFGEFVVEMWEMVLDLAKNYLSDGEYIAAVGKSELINIAEFRSTTPLHHKITVEQQEDTIETKLGRHLTMMNILQYVGQKLEPEDIGRMAENMPFGNWKDTFSRLTQNDRNVKNDFLAIERGEMPFISPNDDSDFCLDAVATRKKERDFQLLPPPVQALYAKYEQIHLGKKQEEMEAAQMAQSEFIPTGGALVTCNIYIPNEDPSKAPKYARLPYEALNWLMEKLKAQGMSQDNIESMNQAQVAELMQRMGGGQPQPQLMQ